jgi:DNA modification methylase
MKPYYEDDCVTLYHGSCLDAVDWLAADSLVTDPPYPNNAGWFVDAVEQARCALALSAHREALVFWTELERPTYPLPLVAVHIWHRSNVNGRPYEPVYHFAAAGEKRRSEVYRLPAVFGGAGPGCAEYLGHPTQKPRALMEALVSKTSGVVADPFAGSGTTLLAAKALGRKAIGIELEERYCEIAARRLSQDVFNFEECA